MTIHSTQPRQEADVCPIRKDPADLNHFNGSNGSRLNIQDFETGYEHAVNDNRSTAADVPVDTLHGIYKQRGTDTFMVRVVLPGGVLPAAKATALSTIAGKYASHDIHLTTRQNTQLYGVKPQEIQAVIRALHNAGLSTFHGGGNVTRNIVCCPLADNCPHHELDVLPYLTHTWEALTAEPALENLPRKLKICFNGCGNNCAMPHLNDIGISAVRVRLEGRLVEGFRVVIGGGHGPLPLFGMPLFEFVVREKIVDVCRAVAYLHRDFSDREHKARARLKHTVKRIGIEECRAVVERYLDEAEIDRGDILKCATAEPGRFPSSRFVTRDFSVGSDGFQIQRIGIPKGNILSDQLQGIAQAAERYGDGHLHVNCRQNIEIHGVRFEEVSMLRKELAHLGLGFDHFFGLSDILLCTGAAHCSSALTRTENLVDALDFVRDSAYDNIRDRVTINISGCPNGCSQYKIADIGFRGTRIRTEGGVTLGYEISVGGDAQTLGQPIGVFKECDCSMVTQVLLDNFRLLMKERETLSDVVKREGAQPFEKNVRKFNIRRLSLELNDEIDHM